MTVLDLRAGERLTWQKVLENISRKENRLKVVKKILALKGMLTMEWALSKETR